MSISGKLVPKERWVEKARAAVLRWSWAPPAEMRRFRKRAFCREKYDELIRMTQIEAGDCIVIPSLDEGGGKSGFLLARAQVSDPRRRRNNCYWYDDRPNKFGCGHVVSVRISDLEPAPFRNDDYKAIAEKLTHAIKPVQRIQNADLLKEFEKLRGGLEIPSKGPLPRFELGKEKQALKRINAQIVARQGQGEFRRRLLSAYGSKCAISGCDVAEVLEAAHIVPHNVSALDDIRNGVLLRADFHTLLDRGLLRINPSTRKVELDAIVRDAYRGFQGRRIREAVPLTDRPDPRALKERYTLPLQYN